MLFVLCLFVFAQFLPGVTMVIEPDAFDASAETAAVAESIRTVPARPLKAAPRDGRRQERAARVAWEGQALPDSEPRPQPPNVRTFLPRRSTSDGRSPRTPSEDH